MPRLGKCIPWTGSLQGEGYGRVRHKGKRVLAHRVAYCKANGLELEDIEGLIVRHRCDNRICVRPSHLLLGTLADNNRDMRERNRQAIGIMLPQTKLTKERVIEIRRLAADGVFQRHIAELFNIGQQNVSYVVHRKSWKHV